ncbi:MAG: sugar phosphate nucleotidyltransferase [Bacteroidota bacterium]
MSILSTRDIWTIVLAGGSGCRLRSFTRRLYGEDRPKQYCAFIGTRSMLQHTHNRALMLVDNERLLTIVSHGHLRYVREQVPPRFEDRVIVQPYCRETAPAIMLPLSRVHHRDPESISVIFPSDHFILDEWKFINYVKQAAVYAEHHPEKIILLGVRPDREDHGYGWIEKGERLNERMFGVKHFIEKPLRSEEDKCMSGRFFWNTFVIIGRTATLMEKIKEKIPQAYETFEIYRQSIDTLVEQQAVTAAYARLQPVNFSSEVLEQIAGDLIVMDISDVGWSDWGEEYRIREDAARYDLRLKVPESEKVQVPTNETSAEKYGYYLIE